MDWRGKISLYVCVWMCYCYSHGLILQCYSVSRDDFPAGFVFGAGTSAYQVEGAAQIDGRGASVWDVFTHQGKFIDGSNADVTADQYHHYREDVQGMQEMGLDAYRFSISWPRIIPEGRGAINPKGLLYYNSLIDELIAHGIEPHVTLFHFDTPNALQDEYGGWLSRRIIKDFAAFAEVCFREFGDRVSHWTTLNEVNTFAPFVLDMMANCRSPSPPLPQFRLCNQNLYSSFSETKPNCTVGNSSNVYVFGYNLILAHAEAVNIYRQKYQGSQEGGVISISYNVEWFEPYSNSQQDLAATQRALDFTLGWLLDPLVFGDYPESMKKILGSRLPDFTAEQSKLLKQSFDFIGIMHYGTNYAKNEPQPDAQAGGAMDYFSDMQVQLLWERNGVPIGNLSAMGIPVVPRGMQEMLEYMKQRYKNPPIIIYENGYGMMNDESLPLENKLQDEQRIKYTSQYLESLAEAIRNGSSTRGYFVWSFMDVFEFFTGFRVGYGLWYVDFKHENRTRCPRQSADWYSHFLNPGHKTPSVSTL